ncbi:hypothetical protein GQ457_HM001370 [Hibiscus cannabinus]
MFLDLNLDPNRVGLLPVGLAPGMDYSWGWDLLGRVDRIRVHEPNRFINKKQPTMAAAAVVSQPSSTAVVTAAAVVSMPSSGTSVAVPAMQAHPRLLASFSPILRSGRWIDPDLWYVILSHAISVLNGGDHRWSLRGCTIQALFSGPVNGDCRIYSGIVVAREAVNLIITAGWSGKGKFVLVFDSLSLSNWVAFPLQRPWKFFNSLAEFDALSIKCKKLEYIYVPKEENGMAVHLAIDGLPRLNCFSAWW